VLEPALLTVAPFPIASTYLLRPHFGERPNLFLVFPQHGRSRLRRTMSQADVSGRASRVNGSGDFPLIPFLPHSFRLSSVPVVRGRDPPPPSPLACARGGSSSSGALLVSFLLLQVYVSTFPMGVTVSPPCAHSLSSPYSSTVFNPYQRGLAVAFLQSGPSYFFCASTYRWIQCTHLSLQ